jgi:hypothetical protein
MAVGEESVPGLEIYLPSAKGGEVRIDLPSAGRTWDWPVGPVPEHLKADAAWDVLLDDWDNRRPVLDRLGAELGLWLFGAGGGEPLRLCDEAWRSDGRVRRIALHLSSDMVAWPWEMLAYEGVGGLSAHPGMALYRLASNERPMTGQLRSLPRVHLVGVKLEQKPGAAFEELATDAELEGISQTLQALEGAAQFELLPLDPVGDWAAFRKRVEDTVPDILHFAGHGLPDGRGLVFRDERGMPVEIDAGQLAALLTTQRTGVCRLAVLNACHAAASKSRRLQPFGSLAGRLSDQGIDHVVAIPVPLVDHEAVLFSKHFYAELARGCGVDVAVQKARRELMLHNGSLVSWALLSLSVKKAPTPLVVPLETAASHIEASLDAFAFKPQRTALEDFLGSNRSMVIVVHGRDRCGHRYVIERVKRDLGQRRLLWQPFGAMRWNVVEEAPEIVNQLLLASLAAAFKLATGGTVEALRARLVAYLVGRPRDKALVVDVEDVLAPSSPSEAAAMVQLVTEVWADLMRNANRCTTFLLLSVAYPNNDDAELKTLAASVVERLASKPRLIPQLLRVEVLDELKAITKLEVAQYIERNYDVDLEHAQKYAERIAKSGFDNERVIESLGRFIKSAWKLDTGPRPLAAPAAGAAPQLQTEGGT